MGREYLGKNHRNARLNRNRKIRALIASGELSPRQSVFLKKFVATRNKALAAMQAGYKGPPQQAGYQAYKSILKKAPDVIAAMGISLENVIENYLLPQMNAAETKFFQHNGKITDFVEVPNGRLQLDATRTLLDLMGAFPPEDPQLAAQMGVKVVVVDIPAPDFSMVDVVPTRPKHKVIEAKASDNGHVEEDPRPKN